MIKTILTICLALACTSIQAQSDSTDNELPELPEIPNSEYAVFKYDSTLETNILTYHYADLWDLDNDGQQDNIVFISNGGAHAFYHLEIWLSSSNTWTKFQKLYTDFPYPGELENINKTTCFPYVVIQDFDSDGAPEIFMCLNHNFAPTSDELAQMGLTTKRILIDYQSDELTIADFKK